MDEKDLLADSIVKALAYQENGGKVDINNPSAGQSGEMKSIFQFLPSTWDDDSKKVFGKKVPLTSDNETYVMKQKVIKWIDEGKNVSEMASIHNSGNPNAYKENHKGVNKYGVPYDTPTYAKNVTDYARKFYDEKLKEQEKPQFTGAQNPEVKTPIAYSNGLLGKAISESKLKIE